MPPPAGECMDAENAAADFNLKDDFSIPVLIRPGLFLGSVAAERNLETLRRFGITHVMQVCSATHMLPLRNCLRFGRWCRILPGTQVNSKALSSDALLSLHSMYVCVNVGCPCVAR